jgi:hypothetical protein
MGEIIKCVKTALAQASEEYVAVQTMGGRMHVRWDHVAQATPHGQIVYFAEFLVTVGIFDNWVKTCPKSPRRARFSGGSMPWFWREAHALMEEMKVAIPESPPE